MTALAFRFALAATLALGCAVQAAEVRLTDDSGRSVALAEPARRIVSLAPHITELLFAAGAGERVVGTVAYTDYPAAAQRIPRIGDSAQLDLERIVALKPDLIVVWLHGNSQRQIERLLELGIPVFYNELRRLDDIARAIEQFGQLAGTESVAVSAASAFRVREADLRGRYSGRGPVRVFYQIWDKPLMTINGDHLISDVIRLCGGKNVFAALTQSVPVISTEAVVTADPEAIFGATTEANPKGYLNSWQNWPRINAVAHDNLFGITADLISRYTPRILEGAQQMCEDLDAARAKRAQ
jgi:iron complex transport system substrate-binding protein